MKKPLRLFLQELRRPTHYIVALAVGTLLTALSGLDAATAVAPFIVPFLVSSIGRTVSRIAAAQKELLLELPAKRTSPAFVIDNDGVVEVSHGRTAELFSRLSVGRIQDLLVNPEGGDVLDELCGEHAPGRQSELYAPALEKWYRATTYCEPRDAYMLVWLDDITEERRAAEQRAAVRQFQIEIVEAASGNEPRVDSRLGHERLARLILEAGYGGVLLAQSDGADSVTGTAFKLNGDGALERSDEISIDPDSHAPIFRSRREGRAVAASLKMFSDRASFERAYPVAPEVRSFLAAPVYNLVNYHAGPTSIVAFNKHPEVSRPDISFLEAAADAAHSFFAAIDVARGHDIRFLQAINGLCASAEFSDEITGAHVWRVNAYAEMIARNLCTDGILCRDIGQVAAAHDIGKVAMPELVQAPRSLGVEEWQRMQLHTVFGAQILDSMIQLGEEPDRRLTLARDIALNHHQRWDGLGYPGLIDSDGGHTTLESRSPATYAGLRPPKDEEIPLSARVVSICDTYDALRSARPYKEPFDHDQAVSIIASDDRSGASGVDRFGPNVFEVFMEHNAEMKEIFETMVDHHTHIYEKGVL